METVGVIAGTLYLGGLVVGGVLLAIDCLFKPRPVIEQRGWKPEGRVLRREDRSIVYEGDPDDPVVVRRKHRSRRKESSRAV